MAIGNGRRRRSQLTNGGCTQPLTPKGRLAFRLVLPSTRTSICTGYDGVPRELKDAMALFPWCAAAMIYAIQPTKLLRILVGGPWLDTPIASETFRFRRFAETTQPTTGIVGRTSECSLVYPSRDLPALHLKQGAAKVATGAPMERRELPRLDRPRQDAPLVSAQLHPKDDGRWPERAYGQSVARRGWCGRDGRDQIQLHVEPTRRRRDAESPGGGRLPPCSIHISQPAPRTSDGSRIFYEPLASWDLNGNLVAVLAAELPSLENGGLSEDGRSVTWKLKEGVAVALDGTPFTADDVVFNWEHLAQSGDRSGHEWHLQGCPSRERSTGQYTVRVLFAAPQPFWADAFVGPNGLDYPEASVRTICRREITARRPANLRPVWNGSLQI